MCDRATPEYDFNCQNVFESLYALCVQVENLHDGVLYANRTSKIKNEFLDLLDREENGRPMSFDSKDIGRLTALSLLRLIGNQRESPLLGSYESEGCRPRMDGTGCESRSRLCLGQKLRDISETLSSNTGDTDRVVRIIMIQNSETLSYRQELKLAQIERQLMQTRLRKSADKETSSCNIASYIASGACTTVKAVGKGSLTAVQATAHGTVAVAKVAASPLRMMSKGVSSMFRKEQPQEMPDSWVWVDEYGPVPNQRKRTNSEIERAGAVLALKNNTPNSAYLETAFCPDLLLALKRADNHYVIPSYVFDPTNRQISSHKDKKTGS